MKIIAIIEKPIASGGGFNQALNAIQQMNRLSVDKFDFSVVTPTKENIYYLKKLRQFYFYFFYFLFLLLKY